MARATKPAKPAKAEKSHFFCTACGNEEARWFGRCPSCGAWNSAAEAPAAAAGSAATGRGPRARWAPKAGAGVGAGPRPLAEVEVSATHRWPSGLRELDRVLGGGVMPGSLVLVGGDPGIGKSTLMLQLAETLAAAGRRVLYVSGEESVEQVRLRAGRLGPIPAALLILAETDLETVLEAAAQVQPDVLVADSIQTLSRADLDGGPGSVSQVRECALALLHYAKGSSAAVFLVGHVTKEGSVAGPRVLEHMVDAVLYLEGERYQHYRVLRAAKNRFGSTNELGVYEMTDGGLREVANPSLAFLSGAPRRGAGHGGGGEPRGHAPAAGRGAGAGRDLVLRHAAARHQRVRPAAARAAARRARAPRRPPAGPPRRVRGGDRRPHARRPGDRPGAGAGGGLVATAAGRCSRARSRWAR